MYTFPDVSVAIATGPTIDEVAAPPSPAPPPATVVIVPGVTMARATWLSSPNAASAAKRASDTNSTARTRVICMQSLWAGREFGEYHPIHERCQSPEHASFTGR